ncbi:MAG: hypothetical protein PHD23_10615, partial [Eubacteriales bacterium]|nr:hypothetical protein [Eubacteriales bacterium]
YLSTLFFLLLNPFLLRCRVSLGAFSSLLFALYIFIIYIEIMIRLKIESAPCTFYEQDAAILELLPILNNHYQYL